MTSFKVNAFTLSIKLVHENYVLPYIIKRCNKCLIRYIFYPYFIRFSFSVFIFLQLIHGWINLDRHAYQISFMLVINYSFMLFVEPHKCVPILQKLYYQSNQQWQFKVYFTYCSYMRLSNRNNCNVE